MPWSWVSENKQLELDFILFCLRNRRCLLVVARFRTTEFTLNIWTPSTNHQIDRGSITLGAAATVQRVRIQNTPRMAVQIRPIPEKYAHGKHRRGRLIQKECSNVVLNSSLMAKSGNVCWTVKYHAVRILMQIDDSPERVPKRERDVKISCLGSYLQRQFLLTCLI